MNTAVAKLGFYSALLSFIGAAGYSIAQLLQVTGALRFPLDAILIYGFSLSIAGPFMLSMLSLHYTAPNKKRIWSHAALLFSVMYVIYVTLNYVVQLATVIPATLRGTLPAIRVLDQTPHSLFWDVDGLGYICMGIATLVAVPVFEKRGWQRWVRGFFLANALMTPVIATVYFYPVFSTALLLIGLPWVITCPGSLLLLTLFFKEKLRVKEEAAASLPARTTLEQAY
ncbi:MAG: hypothetical protein ACTHJ0_04070 [Flavipsychrobacter sp.]